MSTIWLAREPGPDEWRFVRCAISASILALLSSRAFPQPRVQALPDFTAGSPQARRVHAGNAAKAGGILVLHWAGSQGSMKIDGCAIDLNVRQE